MHVKPIPQKESKFCNGCYGGTPEVKDRITAIKNDINNHEMIISNNLKTEGGDEIFKSNSKTAKKSNIYYNNKSSELIATTDKMKDFQTKAKSKSKSKSRYNKNNNNKNNNGGGFYNNFYGLN